MVLWGDCVGAAVTPVTVSVNVSDAVQFSAATRQQLTAGQPQTSHKGYLYVSEVDISAAVLVPVLYIISAASYSLISEKTRAAWHSRWQIATKQMTDQTSNVISVNTKKLANENFSKSWPWRPMRDYSSAGKQTEQLLKCPWVPINTTVVQQYFCIWPLTSLWKELRCLNAVKISITVFFHRRSRELGALNKLYVSQDLALVKAPRGKCWIILPPYSPGLFPTAAHSASKNRQGTCPSPARDIHIVHLGKAVCIIIDAQFLQIMFFVIFSSVSP